MMAGSWQQAKRILCIRLDYMGDVLMSTPAIRALKQSIPGAEITLLTSHSGEAVARFIPEIDHVITYAAPWMKSSAVHDPGADLDMVAELTRRSFDAAVIFTVYSQNPLPAAMLCTLAGIPLRLAHCRENPYRLLSDWVRETEPQEQVRHEVRRQLDLVATVGAKTEDERLSLRVPSASTARVINRLQSMGIDPHGTWIVIHAGATAASRRYPAEHWREVATKLTAALHCPLVFTGGDDEASLIDGIREGLPGTHSLAGRLDLGQLAALIALAPVLVSNNTGPAHIAAAVGTPVVDLYALTNPQHTPWQVPSRILFRDVPCRYCYKSICPEGHNLCLTGVPPSETVQATIELLKGLEEPQPVEKILVPPMPPMHPTRPTRA
jgi:lipopolysaccharide heptosyltransferase II